MSRLYRPILVSVSLLLLTLTFLLFSGMTFRTAFIEANNTQPVGVTPVDCWFQPEANWPSSECYYVHVAEVHTRPAGRIISFPLVVFRSSHLFASKSPVLHLGAGGPGAAMSLDSTEVVKTIWEYYDELSLKQGRDLFVIDPRGSGLSEPLLTCDTYVANEEKRLSLNLSIKKEWELGDQDYRKCYQKFRAVGVNFSAYNSLTVAQDIEILRKLTHTDKWVLYGVSHAATYAQLVANEYPDTVEAMILDSATFPNLKPDYKFIEHTMAPYELLYHYCDAAQNCDHPMKNIKEKIWTLHKTLNHHPVSIEIPHPYADTRLTVTLNGERFLSALLEGIYGVEIFDDIPGIIEDLENRKTDRIQPYLEDHIAYLLDKTYADLSYETHYCYEVKPYTDMEKMKTLVQQLPKGYIRNFTRFSLNWPDRCNELNITQYNHRVAQLKQTDIPVLFLHGELDTITPLDDVTSQIFYYENSQLVSYKLSHSIMTTNSCAEEVAARFVDNSAHLPVDTSCSQLDEQP